MVNRSPFFDGLVADSARVSVSGAGLDGIHTYFRASIGEGGFTIAVGSGRAGDTLVVYVMGAWPWLSVVAEPVTPPVGPLLTSKTTRAPLTGWSPLATVAVTVWLVLTGLDARSGDKSRVR